MLKNEDLSESSGSYFQVTDVIVFACSMLCVSHELSSTCRLVQAALLASEDLPRMAQHVQVPKWRQRLRGKQAWQFEWDLEKELQYGNIRQQKGN